MNSKILFLSFILILVYIFGKILGDFNSSFEKSAKILKDNKEEIEVSLSPAPKSKQIQEAPVKEFKSVEVVAKTEEHSPEVSLEAIEESTPNDDPPLLYHDTGRERLALCLARYRYCKHSNIYYGEVDMEEPVECIANLSHCMGSVYEMSQEEETEMIDMLEKEKSERMQQIREQRVNLEEEI